MPFSKTSRSSSPVRRNPLRSSSSSSSGFPVHIPAQSPPEAVSALSQVNPSPSFECPSEFVAAELDPEDASSSWQTVSLNRSAKGNRLSSRTPFRLSAKVASIVMPVPSVMTSSTSPVSSESSESSELPTYLQVESPLPSRVPASAEMIPASSIHSPSSDPALAEDTQPFVSCLTSEQRAYIVNLSRLSLARHTMSPERLLAAT